MLNVRWLFPCKAMLFLHIYVVNRPYSDHSDNPFSVRPAPSLCYTHTRVAPLIGLSPEGGQLTR